MDIVFRPEPNGKEIVPIVEGNHFALYQICPS